MAEAPTKPRAARPRNGTEVELTVDSFAHGGAGVARLDGYVLFVQGAVPGDRVRAVVTKTKRGYGEARTLEVLEPGPHRIEPRAPHPGAAWQGVRDPAPPPGKGAEGGGALPGPAERQGGAGARRG